MTTIPERIVQVRVGQSGGDGLMWEAPLYITFDVELKPSKKPNKGTVTLYNLNDEHVAFCEAKNQVVQLSAGEGVPSLLFQGDVSPKESGTAWEGGTRKTVLKIADGRRKYTETNFSGSYPPNISRDTILADVIAASGVPSGYIATLPPKQYPAGWAWIGRWAAALDDLLANDAEWSIQHGALQILLAGVPRPGNAVVVSAATGMIGSPVRKKKGVEFKHRLDSRIWPGGPVQFEARDFKGAHRVTRVKHVGDSRGQTWETRGSAVPV